MSTDTKVSNLIINKLTQAQYDAAEKSSTEFYVVTDAKESISDVDGLQEALDKKLENGSTATWGLSLLNTDSNVGSIAIGSGSKGSSSGYATAIGHEAKATGEFAVAVGAYSTASAKDAIQIGYGTNSTANTLSIGLSPSTNYQLLDSSGIIPAARLSTATTPTEDTTTSTQIDTVGARNTKLGSYVAKSEVVDNVTTTTTNVPLSANQGKLLNDRLNNVEARGRYLSQWNCATGLPATEPTTSPYTYKAGDYYIVGTVAESTGTNYKPSGSSYTTGVASTVVESSKPVLNDTYIYDGTNWILQSNAQKEVSFANISGQPTDNTNLASALNEKVTGNTAITASTTKQLVTYDSKGLVTGGSNLGSSDVTGALGYTPYNSTNPNNYISYSVIWRTY